MVQKSIKIWLKCSRFFEKLFYRGQILYKKAVPEDTQVPHFLEEICTGIVQSWFLVATCYCYVINYVKLLDVFFVEHRPQTQPNRHGHGHLFWRHPATPSGGRTPLRVPASVDKSTNFRPILGSTEEPTPWPIPPNVCCPPALGSKS